MRLIDAHDLWTEIMMLPHNGDMISSEEVEKAIVEAPTVDAVPVVRCKDCMRRGTTDCPMLEAFNSYPFYEPEDDAFCSYGVACHAMKTVSQMMNEPKIKTHFARIVVCGTEQNPYYNILYYDPSDKEYHIGYGSYCISFVRQWLAEEFEITPGMNEPVVHGEWITIEDDILMETIYKCSECKEEFVTLDGEHPTVHLWNYRPHCGAKMDGGNEE